MGSKRQGLFVKLKDRKWARAADRTLRDAMALFLVANDADDRSLTEVLREVQM